MRVNWEKLGHLLLNNRNKKNVKTDRVAGYEDIGSGKLPNKYYVTGSSDFWVNEEIGSKSYTWASEVFGFDVKSKEYGIFDTYEEALKKANDITFGFNLSDGPVKDEINIVVIEDHLTGELFSYGFMGNKTDFGYTFRVDMTEDISFTKSQLEEAGFEFK